MIYNKFLVSAISVLFLFGCASRQKTDTDQSSTAPAASSSTQASSDTKTKSQPAERTDGRKVKSKDGVEGEIFGTPAPGSKFSKLEIGMSKSAVESLIGAPNDQDSHITGKQFRPFYFGGDTMRVQAFYKAEGQLTYSNNSRYTGPDTLIVITVDRNATGKRQ